MLHIISDPDILMREIDAYSSLPDELKDKIRTVLSSANPHLALRHSSQGRGTNGETQVHTYVRIMYYQQAHAVHCGASLSISSD